MTTDHNKVTPYGDSELGKKEQVRQMFNNISGKYDFLNHFLSLGIDKLWRKKAIKILMEDDPKDILDVATGTGDFALESLKLNPRKVKGVDIAEKMLDVGRQKVKKKGLENIIQFEVGDSENLAFEDGSFDAATVGFGVRNFENLEKGLSEIHRVLRTNAKFVVLEFSKPSGFPFKQVYNFYFKYILPRVGSSVSKDDRAYAYLHESVQAFPEGKAFLDLMGNCGFKDCYQVKLLNGIASIYVGKKY